MDNSNGNVIPLESSAFVDAIAHSDGLISWFMIPDYFEISGNIIVLIIMAIM